VVAAANHPSDGAGAHAPTKIGSPPDAAMHPQRQHGGVRSTRRRTHHDDDRDRRARGHAGGLALNNPRDRERFLADLPDDCIWETPDGTLEGRAAIAAFQRPFDVAFPDHEHLVRRVIVEGETAAAEGVWVGTHSGPMETPQRTIPRRGSAWSCRSP
jgi:hypothetical protein